MMTTPSARWPDAARCAVVVTVDFNDVSGIITSEPTTAGREKTLSAWRYGAKRGVDRLLETLREFEMPASWFIPGLVAEEHGALVRRIHEAGHEIGNSGYRCENFDALPLDEQRAAFEAGNAALAEVVGVKPTGFRSFCGNWAPGFAEVLAEAGIRWSSSWRGDDLPYFHPAEAASARLVEIPLHYELEDDPYFAFNLYPPVPPGQSRIASYRDVTNNWRQDFAGFHRFGLCFVLRLHPEIIGTAGRIDVLREVLQFLRAQDGVWFARGAEVAAWWSQTVSANEPNHPVEVFARHLASESGR
jgi:peptidoglycan/xylan/chitin deacetylase (PgdA/CDA1 family)